MRLFILIFFLLFASISYSQIQVNIQASDNTKCNGNPCQYNGPTILINEVMLAPSSGDGSIYDSDNTRRGEWIELYNPDICKSIDISCYFLGNNTPDPNPRNYGGGFTLPQGTIVPPRGFVMVRGERAAAVPSNLLVQNGGNTIEIIVSDVNKICLGGGNRLWFPNAGGWFAFYDRAGNVQDAISWCSLTNSCMTCNPCIPPASGCSYSGNLSGYNNMPANRKNYITSLTLSNYLGQSFHRMPDGGTWESTPAASTYGTCNSTCIPPPIITCNGQAIVTPSGGTPPYTYLWDDTRATRDSLCRGLCGGTYHVTITDNGGHSAIRQVIVNDYIPPVNLNSFPAICIDDAPFNLSGGTPAGGTYSGTGISNGMFDPSMAGAGRYIVRYDYIDSVSCANFDTAGIVVNPLPHINAIDTQTVCSGSSTTAVILISVPAGAIFAWTSSATIGVSGNTPSGTGNIPAQTLNTTSVTQGTVTYTITPTLNNCVGATTTFVIIVKPKPTINVISPQTVCSGSSTTAINLVSVPSGASFSWTSSATTGVSGNTASGTGNIPVQTLSTTAISIGTVIYTITPTLNNCTGSIRQFIVTVKPNPTVNAISPQTVCSEGASSAVTLVSIPSGASFSWTSTATSGITGNLTSGTGSIPSQILITTAATPGSVIYTITPTLNGCVGSTATFVVTVNPKPVVSAVTPQTVCSGGSTSAVVLASIPNGASFAWTSAATAAITGNTVSGTGNIPVQTLSTAAISSGTVTYTITPTLNSCNGTSSTFIVTVNPNPAVNAITPQTVCSGGSTTGITLLSTPSGASFMWTSSATTGIIGNTASGSGNIPSQILSTADTITGTVTYTITPTLNFCAGATAAFIVTLYPRPTVNAIASQTVCSGSPTNAVNLVSTPIGASFAWTSTATAGISGNTAGGTGNIPAQTLSTTSNTPGTVIYTITPSLNNCTGTTNTFVVNVKPKPTVNIISPQTVCSGSSTTAVNLVSVPGGASFDWESTATMGISGNTASGTGNIPVQTLSTTATSIGTVIYTITPTLNNCTGNIRQFIVTVKPNPALNGITPQIVCSQSASSAVTLVTTPSGASFSWTSSATSGITGNIASGSGNIPSQILITTATTPGTVTYTITPTLNSCIGATDTFTVTVKPKPTINMITPQTICSGGSTSAVTLTSIPSGANIVWTSAATAGIIGNTASGTGDIPVQTLRTTGTSAGTVTYTIIPTLNNCNGTASTFVVTVNPNPTVNVINPQTLCSGNSTTAVILASTPSGAGFMWASSATTGITGNIANGTGNIPSQILSTTDTLIGTVVYTITPTLNSCMGATATFVVTLNPRPALNAIASQTVCAGNQTTAVTLASIPSGARFNWTSAATAGISGNTAGGTGNIPAQTLNTTAIIPGTVTYTITTTLNNCNGSTSSFIINVKPTKRTVLNPVICQGESFTTGIHNYTVTGIYMDTLTTYLGCDSIITTNLLVGQIKQVVIDPAICQGGTFHIGSHNYSANGTYSDTLTTYLGCDSIVTTNLTVNPIPGVNVIDSQTVCSGSPTSAISLGSIPAGASFAWTSSATTGISGNTAGGTGDIPAQTLITTSSTQGTVTYTVTPTLNNCVGIPTTFVVNVKPKPTVNVINSQSICSGSSTNAVTIASTPAGADFLWTSSAAPGITGNISNGSGNIPSQTLNSTSSSVGTVIYTITPTLNSCDGGTRTFNVIVTPGITVNTITPQIICSGSNTSLVRLTSTPPGSSYAWTSLAVSGVSGNIPAGTGNIPSQILNTTDTILGTVTYSITPTLNNCSGSTAAFAVSVNPQPTINTLAPQTLCSGGSTSAVTLASTPNGASFAWTSSATTGITGNTNSGTGDIPFQILSTTDTTIGTVTYTITPTLNNCDGVVGTFIVTVYPNPAVNAITPQFVCSGSSTTAITLTSTPTGASYVWTSSATMDITGNTVSGTGDIPSQIISTRDTTIGTVIYTITPTLNNCLGTTAAFVVTINPIPIVNPIASQTICSENPTAAVSLISTPMGANFAWISSATAGLSGNMAADTGNIPAQTIYTTVITPGTVIYTITPTLNNCIGDTTTFIINVKPIKRTVLNPVICQGEFYTTGLHNYTETGFYKDTLTTFLGCDSIIYTTLTVNPVYTIDNPQTICNGQAYFLNSHYYTTEGTYYDTLTTIAGCDSIIVTPLKVNPVYNTNNPQTICNGKTYFFNSHNYTIAGSYLDTLTTIAGCDSVIVTQLTVNPVYSINNPQSVCSGFSYSFNSHFYFAAGTYYDTLATMEGCDSIIVTLLTVIPNPTVSISASANPICTGSATLLTANGATSYMWSDGLGSNNSVSVTPPLTSTYTVTGTLNGCFNTTSLTVTVNPIPPVTVAPSLATICEGDTVELTARGATTYKWSPSIGLSSSTSASIIARPESTTTFLVTGTSLGCSKTVSVTITVNPPPVANFIANPHHVSIFKPEVHFQDMSAGAQPLTWHWSLGDGETSDAPDFYYTYGDTGKYLVTLWVYNQFGCVDSVHDYVVVHPDYTIFIPNAFTPNSDLKNDRFRAYGTGISEFNMKIFNRWGELLFESDNINTGWDGKYEGSLLPKGIYVYYIYFTDIIKREHFRSGSVTLL